MFRKLLFEINLFIVTTVSNFYNNIDKNKRSEMSKYYLLCKCFVVDFEEVQFRPMVVYLHYYTYAILFRYRANGIRYIFPCVYPFS